MNSLKANFSRNQNITETFCSEKCLVEMNNELFAELLNGNIMDTIEVLKQIKEK